MKRLWQQYAAKMEAASLRERVMIFAAVAVLMIALLNALLIEPELATQRRLSREVAARQGEIKSLQEELQKMALARQADPDQANRRQLDALRKQIAELDVKLNEEQRKFAPPERIGALLEELLARNRRLQLVDMRTLPVATLDSSGAVQKPAATAAAEKGAAATPVPSGPGGPIYRHGVEITVTGNYLDLLAYLRELEKLPNQMYWGRLELSVPAHPQTTLSLAWLIV